MTFPMANCPEPPQKPSYRSSHEQLDSRRNRQVKAFFEGETAKLKAEVKALESRLAAVEGVLTKPKDHP